MKKYISVLLVLLIAISMLPVRVMATDETTNSTANETGYSINMPFYLTDQEARCFIGFLFNTKELTEEQLTDGNIYAFLTGQLSGDAEIESGFIFRDTMNAQLSRVVSKFEYASEQGREWM
ncbi:MAG: hypothetical protein ACI4RP_04565, partial [Acutalibacteraceae bacterium]